MVCFVILHYMVLEETQSCVANIKSLEGEKKIIIVDNASPNGSGKSLEEEYKGDSDIVVYLNEENAGFARGNNVGCKLAKQKFDPDFYVVMNNDVEIRQSDFISRVEGIYAEDEFDVLSPDIYSTTGEVHQSPKSLKNMTIERARKYRDDYAKKLKSRFIVPLRCYLKQIRVLKLFYNRKKSDSLHIDYEKKYYNVPLHGSCFVFSRKFMEARENAFFPGTFFYFESEILDYECQKFGFKEVYDPSLKVYHHQNVSTNTVYKDALKKVHFMNEQNYNSVKAFLDYYDK